MKAGRIAIGLALVASAAACGQSPAPLLPAGPFYDGGHTLGGGARGQESGILSESAAGDSTQRGGHTLGSGA
jgi:hypothetical protein